MTDVTRGETRVSEAGILVYSRYLKSGDHDASFIVIDSRAGRRRRGAAVGGTAGAVIGHQLEQQAKEIKQDIPGAVVERVGEGLQVTFASGLLFDVDSDVLREAARKNLATLASSLEKYPNTDLMIVGHTDATGSDAHNMTLSERRAASAASYLAAQGVTRTRLRSAGRGESEPVASNDTDADRQKNRRVEVAIYANEAFKAQALKSQ